jgi:hypothetical protein
MSLFVMAGCSSARAIQLKRNLKKLLTSLVGDHRPIIWASRCRSSHAMSELFDRAQLAKRAFLPNVGISCDKVFTLPGPSRICRAF